LLTANSSEIPQRNGHKIGHRVPRLWCQSAAGTLAGLSHRLLAGEYHGYYQCYYYAGVSINNATPVAGWFIMENPIYFYGYMTTWYDYVSFHVCWGQVTLVFFVLFQYGHPSVKAYNGYTNDYGFKNEAPYNSIQSNS
jgi:hypothetical protein